MSGSSHPFYGQEIVRHEQQNYINRLLSKYKHEVPSETLKQKIWDELSKEKHLGNITIPFKIALRKDKTGKFPDVIEVILDTKV